MDVTDVVGGFGPWQRTILIVIIYRAIPLSFLTTMAIFYIPNTEHWCAKPDNVSWTSEEWKDWAIPAVNGLRSKCTHYNVVFNSTGGLELDFNKTVACKEWDYGPQYGITVTKEFDLVCDDAWKTSLTHTVVKIGNMAAFLPGGYVTDRFGRKRVALWSGVLFLISSTVEAFSPSYNFFLVMRFINGVAFASISTASLCLLLEVLGPDDRHKVSFSFIGGWGLGIMLAPGLYWLDQNWRHAQFITSIPFICFFMVTVWRFVPESVRWLLTVNRDSDAEAILDHAAEKNKVQLGDKNVIMAALKKKVQEESSITEGASYFDLFKTSNVRKWTLTLYLAFFTMAFVYFGFFLTVQSLGASLYLTVFLMGITELPAVAVFHISMKYFRRRRALIALSVLTAACYLAAIPVPEDLIWLRLVFAMLGRLLNISIYNLLWMMAAEVFPTSHRSLGVNGCMTIGRLGTLFSTFLVSVSQAMTSGTWLLIIFGVSMGLSSFLYLLLPETKDKHLPDTLSATKTLAQTIKKKGEENVQNKFEDNCQPEIIHI